MSPSELSSCPFCRMIVGRQAKARHWERLGAALVVFEPWSPVAEGHRLVVPRLHVASAAEAPELCGHAFHYAADYASRSMGLQAFNLVTSSGAAATQTVPHLHVHIVPRSPGDGLPLPWTGQKGQR